MTFLPGAEFAAFLDTNDSLASYRDQFYHPENTIYLDGNSLGKMPLRTKELLGEVTSSQWGEQLIESWNLHWYNKPLSIGAKIAKVTGASPGEVIVCDNTSVNLYKLAVSALSVQQGKTRIVSDSFNFPGDLYILQGAVKQAGPGYELVLAGSSDGIHPNLDDLYHKIDKNTSVVVLSLVAFKSGFMYDMAEVTREVHKKGALVIWDLSHATGAVPVDLNGSDADMAVGCTYKYLNGGPGSPAFLYVRKDLIPKIHSPLQGWFGDNQPFEFSLTYRPAEGIRKLMTGTPPIFNLMAVEPGIDLVADAGADRINRKRILLSEYFHFLFREKLEKRGFIFASPTDPEKRGSHIVLRHPESYRICQALIHPDGPAPRIIPDFREPDYLRFGFAPLYTTYSELYKTAERLEEIVNEKTYTRFPVTKNPVT